MENPTSLNTCTVQRRNGAFCDAPAADDMPFPICTRHAIKLYMRMMEHARSKAGWAMSPEQAERDQRETQARDAARKAIAQGQSVVYYIELLPGGPIKIGFTTNITERCSALRVRKTAVLATEPGGRALELKRHRQFAAIRDGGLENFENTPELRAHIEQVKATHGAPNITTYPRVGRIPST